MPERRKSKDELARESLPSPDEGEGQQSGGTTTPPDVPGENGDFQALTDEEHDEFNELFTLLNSNGYETLGDYSVTYSADIERKVATVSVVLPASNDWDPSTAYTDE